MKTLPTLSSGSSPLKFSISRLVFKMIELTLIEDHVSQEVFVFCGRYYSCVNEYKINFLVRQGRHGVPSYLLCMSYFSHILLVNADPEDQTNIKILEVVNSATNFFLYCLVAEKFRLELKSLVKSLLCNWYEEFPYLSLLEMERSGEGGGRVNLCKDDILHVSLNLQFSIFIGNLYFLSVLNENNCIYHLFITSLWVYLISTSGFNLKF